MMRYIARKTIGTVAPGWLMKYYRRCETISQAVTFRDRLSACDARDTKVDLALTEPRFFSTQKRSEVIGLVARIQTLAPTRMCEIGSYSGGTLALFAQYACSNAKILSLDIDFGDGKNHAFPNFACGKQRITTLRGDSHEQRTLQKVKKWLKGSMLDFLFIDGDHSYSGVENDFAMYAPLLRVGGVLALHDIVPDYRTRYGVPTHADVGEVPLFWSHLKAKGYRTDELIEDVNQDGMGIGMIEWDGRLR
jgi:cephalosporin hydroxylase